jgi:hypothetical protein
MRSCRIDRQLVALYALGHSTGREAEDVQKHVSGCSGCREYVEELRSIQRGFKGVGVEEEFSEKRLCDLPVFSEVKQSRVTLFFWPATIAASILILAGVLFWRHTGPDEIAVESGTSTAEEPAAQSPLSLGTYRSAANHSLEDFDQLLLEQGLRSSSSRVTLLGDEGL